uniref:ZP domain-containing protein n=1 Tax=Magallana gigas TaxID=29159 RepID=A0A8W8M5P8_MAGGI
MKTLLHVCCILELCSMVVVQNIPTFKGRGIRTTNSTRSQQIDIQNMIEAKKRKDYIKRQILHILNFSSISNKPPEQPSSVRPPQKAKKYTPDHSILSEPAAFSNDTSCMQFPIPVEYFDKSVQLKNGDIKVFIREIEFPKGFLYEQCTTLCSENDASKQSHDVKECKSVRKDPLNLDIKFKDGIQFNLSIPNAKKICVSWTVFNILNARDAMN